MWETIDTAPRDGSAVLGFDGVGMTTIRFGFYMGKWELLCPGMYAEDADWEPTHWMPLPDPPK